MVDAPALPDESDLNEPVHVYTKRPRCPRCNSTKLPGNHTTRRENASVRHARCAVCRQRINIVRT